MNRRLALGVLGVTIAVTSGLVLVISDYDAHDFIYSVWAPTRALLQGLNPYDPSELEYFRRYPVPIPAGFYTPAALLLHAPLALLNPAPLAYVVAALNLALIWGGVLCLIPLRTVEGCLAAAVAGTLVVFAAASDQTIELGQLSGAAFFGLALFAAGLRHNPNRVWILVLGTVLVSLKPQSGIPMLVALFALRRVDVLWRSCVILAIASLPGVLLFLSAAGSSASAIATLPANVGVMVQIVPGNLASPYNIRIDALGSLAHLNGPALVGGGWAIATMLAATALLLCALRGCARDLHHRAGHPWLMSLLSVYIVASLYHLTYDQLLLYVGPLAAIGVAAGGSVTSRVTRLLAGGGVVLGVSGLLFRPGVITRIADAGVPPWLLHDVRVAGPTILIAALVVFSLASLRRSDAAVDVTHAVPA